MTNPDYTTATQINHLTGEIVPFTPYQVMPDLSAEEFDSLKEDIRHNGILIAIEVDDDGNLLDGHHRMRAWLELVTEGVPLDAPETVIRQFASDAEKRNFARTVNLKRRHLSREQRDQVIRSMRADGMSIPQIEEAANVGRGTVQRAISTLPIGKVEFPDTITVKDGRTRPAKKRKLTMGDALKAALNAAPETVRKAAVEWGVSAPENIKTIADAYRRNTDYATTLILSGELSWGDGIRVRWDEPGVAFAAGLKEYLKEQARIEVDARRADREQAAQRLPAVDNLYHGSCLDVLPTLPMESIKLLLTDPPYGMDFQSNRRVASPKAGKITGDADLDGALDLLAAMLAAADPLMMPNCHLLIFTGWRYEPQFRTVIEEAGYDIAGSLVWVKENHSSGDLGAFAPRHERIIHARRGNAKIYPREDDVLIHARSNDTEHPTEKPITLLRTLIECTTELGERVLDPFAGSGSAVVAAQECGRVGIGIELEAQWFAVCAERLGYDA
jgi:site-specific DNA-methyltransferase (adenine-specific)